MRAWCSKRPHQRLVRQERPDPRGPGPGSASITQARWAMGRCRRRPTRTRGLLNYCGVRMWEVRRASASWFGFALRNRGALVYSRTHGMRRGREDQLSETGSRPAFLDEFERRLAAALAQQTDARKTRFGSARSSDVNVEVPSSPSLGEAITPRSMGEEQPAKVEQPSSETREKRTQFSSAEPTRVSPQGDSAHDAAKAPAAGGTADVHATQPAARLSDLAETSSAGRALKSPTEPSESSATQIGISDKVTQALQMKRRRPSPTPCREATAMDLRRRSGQRRGPSTAKPRRLSTSKHCGQTSKHCWQTTQRSRRSSNLPTFTRVRWPR